MREKKAEPVRFETADHEAIVRELEEKNRQLKIAVDKASDIIKERDELSSALVKAESIIAALLKGDG